MTPSEEFLQPPGTAIEFGTVALREEEQTYAAALHRAIMAVLQSLPTSVQTEALLALARHLKLSFAARFNFFQGFYPPAWTILVGLEHSRPQDAHLNRTEKKRLQMVHATAMLLHLLDDHLNDNELPASHLNVLIRSQLWLFMRRALDDITATDDGGRMIAERYIDTYYASVGHQEDIDSLEAYADRFAQQMAMGFIAPEIMTRRLRGGARRVAAVKSCYAAFGRAWRLLDDVHDIQADMAAGTPSAVYFCLPAAGRSDWRAYPRTSARQQRNLGARLMEMIQRAGIRDRLVARMCHELHTAAETAETLQMTRYAEELRWLAAPLMRT